MGKKATKKINLALQGGGAHGAFTWGVLDRLLEEPGLEIAAMSGTSAGALNGAAVKSGLVQGSRQAARDKLDWLWGQIGASDSPGISDFMSRWAPPLPAVTQLMELSPPVVAARLMSSMTSPYQLGPLYHNPLERIVDALFCADICKRAGPVFFICATNVRSGKIKVFREQDITPEAILASACLPTLHKAIDVTDPRTGKTDTYWDGGYTGNPALFPLFEKALPDDVVIININPLYRDEIPTSAHQIQNRINEISFNSSLLRELRAIAFVKRLIAAGNIEQGQMKRVLVHMISDDALMNELSVVTKTIPVTRVLDQLKRHGRAAAETFLTRDIDNIGKTDSVDLDEMFS